MSRAGYGVVSSVLVDRSPPNDNLERGAGLVIRYWLSEEFIRDTVLTPAQMFEFAHEQAMQQFVNKVREIRETQEGEG